MTGKALRKFQQFCNRMGGVLYFWSLCHLCLLALSGVPLEQSYALGAPCCHCIELNESSRRNNRKRKKLKHERCRWDMVRWAGWRILCFLVLIEMLAGRFPFAIERLEPLIPFIFLSQNGKKSKRATYENRTVFVDFNDQQNYHRLCGYGKAFVEFTVAFILSTGFQLKHKNNCCGGISLTPHSHYVRIRLNHLTIYRLQCTHCKVVFTIQPHFVLRSRSFSPQTAQDIVLATHNGMSLEVCSMICHVSPMAIYRFICSIGKKHVTHILVQVGLKLPEYPLADEKHSKTVGNKLYLPTVGEGRVIWHLGCSSEATADAFQMAYAPFQQAAQEIDPHYQPRGILTDGFESTRISLKYLFPSAKLGICLLHAAKKVASKLKGIPSDLRKTLSWAFSQIIFRKKETPIESEIVAMGQRLRRFKERVRKEAGESNAHTIGQWFQKKKDGWYKTIKEPKMPQTSTYLDQAHNWIDRKLFMMQGFHHLGGKRKEFINALAILYNMVPYQRRALNAGSNGIQVQGGILPHPDWFFSLTLLTAAGGLVRVN